MWCEEGETSGGLSFCADIGFQRILCPQTFSRPHPDSWVGINLFLPGQQHLPEGNSGLNWCHSQPACAEGLPPAPAVPPAPLLMESAVESSSVPFTGAVPKVWLILAVGQRLEQGSGTAGAVLASLHPSTMENSVGCAAALQDPCPGLSPALSGNTRSRLTLRAPCSPSLFSSQRHPSGFSQARIKPESPWITKRHHSHVFLLRYFPTPCPTKSPQLCQSSWSHWH